MLIRNLVTAAMLCGMIVPCNAVKADDDEKKTKSQKVEVRVHSSKNVRIDGDDEDVDEKVEGEIIVIDADGKKSVFKLGDKLPDDLKQKINIRIDGDIPQDLIWITDEEDEDKKETAKPRYMVGVMCEPTDDLLRKHLQLEGYGLTLTGVSEGMPAAKADLAEGDILLKANDDRLDTIESLVKVVASSKGEPIEFVVLKKGERHTISITPKKATPAAVTEISKEFSFPEGIPGGNGRFMLRRLGPGLRLPGGDFKAILEGEGGVEAMHLQRLLIDSDNKFRFKEGVREFPEADVTHTLEMQLKALQKQMTTMERQLKAYKKKQAKADREDDDDDDDGEDEN